MTDQVENFETDEDDEYHKMLTMIGRSADDDLRVSIHESGHATCARILGKPLGGATVQPDTNGRYGGLVWGPEYTVSFSNDVEGDGERDAQREAKHSNICARLRNLMPRVGEDHGGDVADIYAHIVNRCTELAAGTVAEKMLLPGAPVPSVSDVEQAVELASLISTSSTAAEHFLKFCEQRAYDLLFPHVPIIMALSIVLRIRRTLDAAAIDEVIGTTVAGFELAREKAARREWQARAESAKKFEEMFAHR